MDDSNGKEGADTPTKILTTARKESGENDGVNIMPAERAQQGNPQMKDTTSTGAQEQKNAPRMNSHGQTL